MNKTIELSPASDPAWFKHWFDSSFYHQLYANRDEKEAAGFIDELLANLQPSQNASMLDLGCGTGRHARYLASNGFNVTGIDLAASSIRSAQKYENGSLQFYRHDMRLPFGRNCYNIVFNFFTSFGYFKTSEEDHQVVGNIAAALKPGGMLVMDYINSAWSEKRSVPSETKEIDGIIYHITRHSDEKHFFKKITIEDIQPGEPFEYTEQVAKFSLTDFDKMFSLHGLELQQVSGDYNLGSYDAEKSPRLILLAKKK